MKKIFCTDPPKSNIRIVDGTPRLIPSVISAVSNSLQGGGGGGGNGMDLRPIDMQTCVHNLYMSSTVR